MVSRQDKEKDKEKAIDNGRSKKEPSCVADVVAEDCVSPLQQVHGSGKSPAEKYRLDAGLGHSRCYFCFERRSAEESGEEGWVTGV